MIRILLIAVLLTGCTTGNQNLSDESGKELELTRKELALKEKELELREKELEIARTENELSNNQREDLSSLYKALSSSVFTIYTLDDENNPLSQGTAFTIDPSGIALSNYHVFENAATAVAINHIGEKFLINEIIAFDKELDYLIFSLGPNSGTFSYLNMATEIPSVGEECFAIGTPEGLTNSLSKGIISGFRANQSIIQTDTEIAHGNSGGPLFNDRGDVIGITTAGIEGENLNFAINIQVIPAKEYINSYRSNKYDVDNDFDAKGFVYNYFDALQSEDYSRIRSLYASEIKRYYGAYNTDREWVIDDIISYKTKFKINSVQYLIDSSSIVSFVSANGNNIVEFEMDYLLDRQEKWKPSNFHLKLFIEVNYNGKIVSIYEDILDKY